MSAGKPRPTWYAAAMRAMTLSMVLMSMALRLSAGALRENRASGVRMRQDKRSAARRRADEFARIVGTLMRLAASGWGFHQHQRIIGTQRVRDALVAHG